MENKSRYSNCSESVHDHLHLHHSQLVFDGEDIRFFTHGYDVYTPDQVLVTHDYHVYQSNPIVHTWGHGTNQQQNENNSPKTD